jgi:hypothetical protein
VILRLLHQLSDHLAELQLLASRFVEVGCELRKRRKLAVLRERKAHAAAGVAPLHDLGLRGAAHPRNRDAGVDRRPDACIEQIRLEEDLAVGDRDHVRRARTPSRHRPAFR